MSQKSFIDHIKEIFDKGEVDLPVFHVVAFELQRLINHGNFGISDVTKIIQKDQSLASCLLKMANSAFYAGLNPPKTIHDAAMRIGEKSLIGFTNVVVQKSLYQSNDKELKSYLEELWRHALVVAISSRWLSFRVGFKQVAEECFLGGLFHDIGKLLLLKVIVDLKNSEFKDEKIGRALIDEILETMHPKQGEVLLKHCGLPDIYCQVALLHHNAEVVKENVVLNIVRLGNLVCRKVGIGLKKNSEMVLSATDEAETLAVKDLLLAELQVMLEENLANPERLLASN
jgi:HD-like signal output (HDOD) protein